MHFRDIVAADLQLDDGMAATLGQQYTAHLWIGPFAILIAAAPKGCLIGSGISGVEDRPIDGHEPIAPKESAGHRLRLRQYPTALVQQRLQALAAQFRAAPAQRGRAQLALRLSRMQRAE